MKKHENVNAEYIDEKIVEDNKNTNEELPDLLTRKRSIEIISKNYDSALKDKNEENQVDALNSHNISSLLECPPPTITKSKEIKQIKQQELIELMTPAKSILKYTLIKKFLFRVFFIFVTIVNFVSLGLAIYIFLIYFETYSQDNSNMIGVLSMIKKSFNDNPITDFKFINLTSQQQCPSNYQIEIITEWNGLTSGCWCQSENKVYKGSCTMLEKVSCQTLDSIPSYYFTIWSDSKICVKRVSQYSLSLNQCQIGFKKCGIYVCIPESEDCPITIQNLTQKLTNSTTNETLSSFSQLMASNVSFSPLIHFNFARNQLCLDINAIMPRQNGLSYPLELQPIPGCGKYSIYQETSILENEPEISLYQENLESTTNNNWLSTYPQFNVIIQNQTISLMAKFQPLLTNSSICMLAINGDYKGAIDQIYFRMIMYSLIAYLSLIGIGLSSIISIGIILYLIKFKWDSFDDNTVIRNTIFVCTSFTVVLFILLSIQNSIISSSNDQNLGNFPNIAISQCFQNTNINQALTDFWYYLDRISNGLHITMIYIWMVFYCICFLIGLIFQTAKYFINFYAKIKTNAMLSKVNQAQFLSKI